MAQFIHPSFLSWFSLFLYLRPYSPFLSDFSVAKLRCTSREKRPVRLHFMPFWMGSCFVSISFMFLTVSPKMAFPFDALSLNARIQGLLFPALFFNFWSTVPLLPSLFLASTEKVSSQLRTYAFFALKRLLQGAKERGREGKEHHKKICCPNASSQKVEEEHLAAKKKYIDFHHRKNFLFSSRSCWQQFFRTFSISVAVPPDLLSEKVGHLPDFKRSRVISKREEERPSCSTASPCLVGNTLSLPRYLDKFPASAPLFSGQFIFLLCRKLVERVKQDCCHTS